MYRIPELIIYNCRKCDLEVGQDFKQTDTDQDWSWSREIFTVIRKMNSSEIIRRTPRRHNKRGPSLALVFCYIKCTFFRINFRLILNCYKCRGIAAVNCWCVYSDLKLFQKRTLYESVLMVMQSYADLINKVSWTWDGTSAIWRPILKH